MARSENKSQPRPARSGARDPEVARPSRNRELVLAALGASLFLSVVLTLDLVSLGPAALIGRTPQPGDIADRSYKAPADITIEDREATDERLQAAIEQAPVVYDLDDRQAASVRERLTLAFLAGRAAIGGEIEAEEGPDPGAAFQEALGEGVEVGERALEGLRARGFPAEDRGAVLGLINPALSLIVVDDSVEFDRRRERRIVLVRELGSELESSLSQDQEVLDLKAVAQLIEAKADELLAERPRAQQRELLSLARALVRPNLRFNLRATDERRQEVEASVKEVTISLRRGEIIVRDGEAISELHLLILDGIREQARTRNRVQAFVAVWALIFLLLVVTWRFGSSSISRFPREARDMYFLLTTLLLTALGTRLAIFVCDAVAGNPEFMTIVNDAPVQLYYVIPVAAATMLVRMVQSGETAALFAVVSSLIAGLQIGGDLSYALYTLIGSLVAAVGVARVSQRGTLLRAGVRVGATNSVVVAVLVLLDRYVTPVPMLVEMGSAFFAGCLAGGVVSAVAPLAETVFAYTTDVKLLELANREQQVLRELEVRAPGTYHHSMMVGHLAEKAAETIGANSLLAKVAGYYHDIGKMRRPHFFVENVTIHGGENRHEKLSPSMSSRIIQAHVKDGLELGRRHKLAPAILRGIGEHHGTSVIRYFYEKAKEQLDPEKGELVEEQQYRYPGPKPQTREAGILMLADSVEAASRTLSDTTPSRIQQLVQRITNNYFRDGQLDDCSLTLRDLHAIARSFIETLSAIRHERIDYPEPTDAEGRKLDEGSDEGVVERIESRQRDRSERAAPTREDDIKRLGIP